MTVLQEIYTLHGYRTQISEWLSIVSMLISIYVAIQVRRVKFSVSNKVQLPGMIEDLKDSVSKISSLMADFDANKNEIGAQIEVCRARLKIIAGLTRGQPRATVKKIWKATKNLNKNLSDFAYRSSMKDIWSLYQQVNGALEELKHEHDLHKMGI